MWSGRSVISGNAGDVKNASMRSIRVGTDFDNTIVGYDHLFRPAARRLGIETPASLHTKTGLRDYIRSLPDGEVTWQKMQAHVYGPGMAEAILLEGFTAFLGCCRPHGVPVYIVSHKTRSAAQNPDVDLRAASLQWMEMHGFFDEDATGLSLSHVFFEDTRACKIDRIRQLGCTHFVDDMTEVLLDDRFPDGVVRILFAKDAGTQPLPDVVVCPSWYDVAAYLFREESGAR